MLAENKLMVYNKTPEEVVMSKIQLIQHITRLDSLQRLPITELSNRDNERHTIKIQWLWGKQKLKSRFEKDLFEVDLL
jgi:hypothetical protein